MSKLEHTVHGLAAMALAVALTACVATEPTASRQPVQPDPSVEKYQRLRQQQLERLRQQPPLAARPGIAPATPAAEPPYQLCRLDTQSCMALDPRPFVLCPAADNSVCDAEGSVMLLDTPQPALARPTPQATPQPSPQPSP